MPSRTLQIPWDSDLHRQIVKMLDSRIKFAEQGNSRRHAKWEKAEDLTLAYLPEQEEDRLRRDKRDNEGKTSYTTIQLPYTYALLMTAHTYVASVFFARNPVHQFAGNHGEGEDQVQAVEALISYQVNVGEMLGPYYVWIYDTLKYGYGVLGEYWDKQILNVGEIAEITDPMTGTMQKVEVVKEVVGYEGNRLYNISPYDFMHDPRVPAGRFQEGEFCCVLCRLNWTTILRRERLGLYMNVDLLNKHTGKPPPVRGSAQLERPETKDWINEGVNDKHPAESAFYEVYVDLIPSEWGLGNTDYPMKWVFTITYDKELIVGASPLGYLHCKFPFMVGESEVEGYGLFSRGVPDIMEPIQNTMDWLVNSHFYNVRAALNNQFIMDPSRIVVEDAQDGGPGFRYRLRPEAFGGKIDDFFKQVPVTDVTRAHMQDLQQMHAIGEKVYGINDQMLGAIGGTTRRTATEVRTATSFGVNRMKTISEFISATAFGPHAQRLVQNSQQYYDGQQKFRIVGDLALPAGPAFMDITPEKIAGFYEFVPVDGNLPVDRMAQATLWKELLANLTNYPQIMMQYDMGKIFGWVATLAGLKNINRFKLQVLPPGMGPSPGAMPMGLPPPGGSGVEPGNAMATQMGLNSMNGGENAG